jgi:hypothetical protein
MNKNGASVLEKISKRARQIVRESPNISYRDAQKQAGLERREGVSGRRKSPHVHKGKAKAGGAVGAKYRVRHVVEKIGAAQVNQTRQQLKHELEQQRAWMLLAKDSATSAAKRKKAAADLAANKKELKAITGVKKKRRKASGKKRRR